MSTQKTQKTKSTETSELTSKELLQEVTQAIREILVAGQSYQIGSRKLTRADLATLRDIQKELTAEVNADTESTLLDDTYVAFFTGR